MRKRYPGFFITFEGTKEGLGKSTQAQLLCEKLRNAGHDVVLTREPGGTPIGAKIREIMLNPDYELSKATELFLQEADRAQHYKEVLKPALRAGKVVISDRFVDSTLVYQGNGREWKSAFLWRLHHACTGSLLPDLTLVLHGEPFIAKSGDRIERAGPEFFERVERGMLHLISQSKRYVLMNANENKFVVSQRIFNVVKQRMENRASEIPSKT